MAQTYQQTATYRELSTRTRAAGGGNNYETMSGIDAQQNSAMNILQATIPLQYGFSSSSSGGGNQMLMTSLNPNRKSNPALTPLGATPVSSLRYDRLAAASGKSLPKVPVYGSSYWSISQGYQG